MPRFQPAREAIVAAIVAPLVVAGAIFAWLRQDRAEPECCDTKNVRLESVIPTDSLLRVGQLSNAFHYYVRANSWPANRAEVKLVINAGSVLEADDQRGLAHAVEHMLFRGTRHFPGHAVDDYLESIGMRPGSDINASTSRDETIVRITVPTDRAGALDTALAILADMAHYVTFDSEAAAQEAGVVMSEWRSDEGAATRLRKERNALLFANSRYADREVIGDTAVLRRFDIGAMRRFYNDWYRPDLMAVVVVGDFDENEIVGLVRHHFGSIPAVHAPRARDNPDVPFAAAARAVILGDPEATATRISLWHLSRPVPLRRLADYRGTLIDELWQRVLDERLDDASAQPGSPILTSSVETSEIARSLGANIVRVQSAEKRETAALETVSAEVARIARFGVSEAEVKRRAAALLRERRNDDEWADHSGDIADGLIATFLTGDVFVNRATAFDLTRTLLPTITPADILARVRALAIDSSALIVVTRPHAGGAAAESDQLVVAARAAADRVSPPSVEAADTAPLLSSVPAPGRIATERIDSDARVFDWKLANGMRVILKPTRFSFDQIELRLQSSAGASLASAADYPSAFHADAIVRAMGVGPVPGRVLGRRLDETSVTLNASVEDDGIAFSGQATPHDMELMFQVLYLYFTQPRVDTAAFRRYSERLADYTRGRAADPDAIFGDSVAAILAQHSARGIKGTKRFVAAIDLTRALEFWKARMANPASFTLVMTGDFTLDRARALISEYLASLPSGSAEQSRDDGIRFPKGVVRREIVAGAGPKARTQIILSGPYEGTDEAGRDLSEASDVAELALNSHLRERLGGTYGASVSSSVNLVPPATYSVTIDFDASPERIDSLATAALAELDRLRTAGPAEMEYQKIKAARVRDLDGKAESNKYWASELMWHARMGWPLGTILGHELDAKSLSANSLRAACAKYLKASEYVQVTMYPMGKKPH